MGGSPPEKVSSARARHLECATLCRSDEGAVRAFVVRDILRGVRVPSPRLPVPEELELLEPRRSSEKTEKQAAR